MLASFVVLPVYLHPYFRVAKGFLIPIRLQNYTVIVAKAPSEAVAALRSPSALSALTCLTVHHVGCTARTWSNRLTQSGRCVVYFAPRAGCVTVSIGTTPGEAAAAAAGGDR